MPEIREALEKAFEPDDDADPITGDAPEPVVEEVAAEPARERTASEIARDEQGRFAKKLETDKTETPKPAKVDATKPPPLAAPSSTPAPLPGATTGTPAPDPAITSVALKAPQSLRPAAREAWSKAPKEIQEDVVRLEADVKKTLQETADARRTQQAWKESIAPFEPMIRTTMGGDPIRAAANMFRFAEAMNTAPEPHKAALLANLMRAHGVGVEALASALNQDPAQQQQSQPVDVQAAVRQALAEQMNAAKAQQLQSAIGEFGKDKEFFEDVRADMADLFEMAHRRGASITLGDAYTRALKLHPEISGVLDQREAAKRAATAQAATQRSRNAASSVKSSPAGAPNGAQSSTLRETIEAAIAARRP